MTDTKNRLAGYYWVLAPETYVGEVKWVIAEWYIPDVPEGGEPYPARWELHGTNLSYDDSYFHEINPQPIKCKEQ